ncbi:MAG: 50S ribosomal protein L30 [Clostridiales bacterium]|nr:50S ribosomal protein L30 [Clostridiales bacterium]
MKIKVELVKSPIGAIPKHRKTVAALGLKKLHSTNEFEDTAAVRGMIKQVSHLLKVTEV